MPYEISQLLKDLGTPVSATSDEPLQTALSRMLDHGFSQLPVVKMAGQRKSFHLVTLESILLALHNFGSSIRACSLRVDDALVKVPRTYQATDDLFDVLLGMRDMDAALILDDEGALAYVVTTYDTSRYFRQWAEDMMHVRNIEHTLKGIINTAFRKDSGEIDEEVRQGVVSEITSPNRGLRKRFDHAVKHYTENAPLRLDQESADSAFLRLLGEHQGIILHDFSAEVEGATTSSDAVSISRNLKGTFVAALQHYLEQASTPLLDTAAMDEAFKLVGDRADKPKDFNQLTLGDYVQVFFKDVCWEPCKDIFRVSRDEAKNMLEGVQQTRNALAHFREHEVTAQQRAQLRICADWLGDRKRDIDATAGEKE